MKRALALLLSIALGRGVFSGSVALGQGQAPPVNLTVAFIGDQGLGASAEEVLHLIRNEHADAVIHSGDFDYADNPAAWEAQIDASVRTSPTLPLSGTMMSVSSLRQTGIRIAWRPG